MKRPPILTPIRTPDGQYHISRSTPSGRSEPYAEPVFQHKAMADGFCSDRNTAAGRSREDVVMARLRVHEVVDVEWEEIINNTNK